ncbi:hypothetical protein PVAP13_8NG123100 [Panicum virgatum]|uniref:Uncharacterized protein n=1 Tax=Panicum virgatum TaxID=38727 RepID=A0A8T0PJ28_PANVG|nr:hypothetical protein PVAP13_8NG123100 [Panicum virgatum]
MPPCSSCSPCCDCSLCFDDICGPRLRSVKQGGSAGKNPRDKPRAVEGLPQTAAVSPKVMLRPPTPVRAPEYPALLPSPEQESPLAWGAQPPPRKSSPAVAATGAAEGLPTAPLTPTRAPRDPAATSLLAVAAASTSPRLGAATDHGTTQRSGLGPRQGGYPLSPEQSSPPSWLAEQLRPGAGYPQTSVADGTTAHGRRGGAFPAAHEYVSDQATDEIGQGQWHWQQ